MTPQDGRAPLAILSYRPAHRVHDEVSHQQLPDVVPDVTDAAGLAPAIMPKTEDADSGSTDILQKREGIRPDPRPYDQRRHGGP